MQRQPPGPAPGSPRRPGPRRPAGRAGSSGERRGVVPSVPSTAPASRHPPAAIPRPACGGKRRCGPRAGPPQRPREGPAGPAHRSAAASRRAPATRPAPRRPAAATRQGLASPATSDRPAKQSSPGGRRPGGAGSPWPSGRPGPAGGAAPTGAAPASEEATSVGDGTRDPGRAAPPRVVRQLAAAGLRAGRDRARGVTETRRRRAPGTATPAGPPHQRTTDVRRTAEPATTLDGSGRACEGQEQSRRPCRQALARAGGSPQRPLIRLRLL